MNKLPILAVLFALTACAPTGPPAPEPEPAPEAALDPALATAVDSLAEAALRGEVEDAPAVAGLAVGIARNGEPVHLRGYGLADAESGTAVTERTVFRIGSVTKPFTAAAVMRLVEAGDVALDDDIREHLPDAPTRGRTRVRGRIRSVSASRVRGRGRGQPGDRAHAAPGGAELRGRAGGLMPTRIKG